MHLIAAWSRVGCHRQLFFVRIKVIAWLWCKTTSPGVCSGLWRVIPLKYSLGSGNGGGFPYRHRPWSFWCLFFLPPWWQADSYGPGGIMAPPRQNPTPSSGMKRWFVGRPIDLVSSVRICLSNEEFCWYFVPKKIRIEVCSCLSFLSWFPVADWWGLISKRRNWTLLLQGQIDDQITKIMSLKCSSRLPGEGAGPPDLVSL